MNPPSKILIIQLRRIGDVIVTTPVIDALRTSFPNAQIDFLVEDAAAPVLKNYAGLNDTLLFDKNRFFAWAREIRGRKYDWVLDFMNNPRTAQLTLASGAPVRAGFIVPGWGLVYNVRVPRPATPMYAVQSKFNLLRALGLNPPAEVFPKIHLTDDDFSTARPWWEKNGLDRFRQRIAIVPTHRHAVRRWPAHRFTELMERLLRTPDRALILFGGPGEEQYLQDVAKPFPEKVFRIPAGPLRQAAAILSRCHATATSDNGVMHLSVSVGTPTVTVYGPTWPESWNPRIAPHRWVQAEGLSCLGCNFDKCPYAHECMEWVSAERVHREVESVLAGRL